MAKQLRYWWMGLQSTAARQLPGPPPLAPPSSDSRSLADAFLDSLGAEDNGAPPVAGTLPGALYTS